MHIADYRSHRSAEISRSRARSTSRLALVSSLLLWAGAGCDSSGALGLLELFLPSDEELAAWEEAMQAFHDEAQTLPSLSVRMVNTTAVTALVGIGAASEGPKAPGILAEESCVPDVPNPTDVDWIMVLVEPGDTAVSTVKCGQVIGVCANVPSDVPDIWGLGQRICGSANVVSGMLGMWFDEECALCTMGYGGRGGNVRFSGAGTPTPAMTHQLADNSLSGPRYLRPDEDGLDCETGTLVIRIDAPGTPPVIGDQTWDLMVEATPGTGVLSVE